MFSSWIFPQIFFNDINHGCRVAILKKNYFWLLPSYMAVTTYCYHENVHRTMRTAIVSDLLKPNYCKQPFRENPKNSFIAQFMTILVLPWVVKLVIIWEMFHWKMSLNSVLLLLLLNFVSGLSLDTHLYGRVAAIVYTNYFFHLYQQNKSYKSKLTFRQASYYWKKVLEAAKLPYANKTKEIINFQKPESQDFWWIATSVTSWTLQYVLFQIAGKSHLWSLYLRMLGKGLLLKTISLLVFFLWLVKSLKNF